MPIRAFVFDAYGTLFDVHAVARCTSCRDAKRRDSKQTSSMSHAIVCPDGKARSENTVRVSAETAPAGPIRLAMTLRPYTPCPSSTDGPLPAPE